MELLKTLQAEGVRPEAGQVSVLREIGPRAVSRTILLRLARLSSDAVAVARAVAVLGEGAALPAVAAVAALAENRVAEATRALVAAEILQPEASLAFVHALVRDVVYHELSPTERQLAHEQAARALSALGAAPELVAGHLLAMPPRREPWVAKVLWDAGRLAGRRGDTESAVACLRRAVEESSPALDRSRALMELGAAEAMVAPPAAVEHMQEAHERLEDPLQRALAAEMLARSLVFVRPPDEAVRVVRQALIELPARHSDQRRALEAFELYAVAFGAEVPDAAARLARVRANGVGRGVGAKMLSVVAAWGTDHGGRSRS